MTDIRIPLIPLHRESTHGWITGRQANRLGKYSVRTCPDCGRLESLRPYQGLDRSKIHWEWRPVETAPDEIRGVPDNAGSGRDDDAR